MKNHLLLVTIVFVSGFVACDSGPRSPIGFRLPEGDIEQGKAAFLELQCHTCHQVAGLDLPAPTAEPPVPVVLGGEVFEVRTDGYLLTSIIHPSHKIAQGYHKEQMTTSTGESRMPDHSDVMTVRQLIDLVAFLQSTYNVIPPPQPVF